jgi:hypothetical protein
MSFGSNFKASAVIRNSSAGLATKKEFPQPIRLTKDKPQAEPPKPIRLLEVGTRVFHEKFGVGEIERIVEVGGSTLMYSVNFTLVGKRMIDPSLQSLKKF